MKPLHFTYHAPASMAQRDIPPEWIERVVRQPLWTEPDPLDPEAERRSLNIPEHGDRVLRVAVVETETHIRVISTFFDRRATRRHARHDL